MKGYLELILDGTTGEIPDATRAFIEKVIAANKRLIQLVNDLLEVARSQAGRLTIKVAPIDIAPQITSSLDELKSLADEKSVAMAYATALPGGAMGAPLPQVMADADRVKEVVVNLVGNAIKYMGGAGAITISHEIVSGAAGAPLSPNAAPGSASSAAIPATYLVTHITDTGIGISAEAQEKFSKNSIAWPPTRRATSWAPASDFHIKEMVEKMGGTICVGQKRGRGARSALR